MVRREMIQLRFERIEEYLEILERYHAYTYDEFHNDPERYGSAERFLQLCIEALNDVGNHVVADLKLGSVDWYAEIPERLEAHGYIDKEIKDVWMRMIGFRNALVHAYMDIDRKMVYDIIQGNLDDIRRLMKTLSRFL